MVVPRPAHFGHGPGGHDLAEQRLADLANFAGAVAGAAASRVGSGLPAGAAARLALHRHPHVDCAPDAGHDVGEREVHHRLGVGAAARAALPALAAEDIAAEERVEEVVEPETTVAERVSGRAARARRPEGPNMSYWRRRSGSRTRFVRLAESP